MTSTHFSTSYMSKRPFPSLPTIASKPHVLNVLPGGVLSLISSDRERHLSDGGSPSNKQQMQQIAKEALRLTRETLTTSSTVSESISSFEKLGNQEQPSVDHHIIPVRSPASSIPGARLNKFVRRLHDMLQSEKDSGVVEWRRGLLVLHSTDAFAKQILPKYFNTRNFKTFRRQLNYYGFVHVRSFSTTGTATTALWVNRDLAHTGSDDISSVLQLRRVEPCETAKTTEGRRVRKELAIHMVEEDLGVSAKTLQMEQIRSMAQRGGDATSYELLPVPVEIHCKDRRRSLSSIESSEPANVVSSLSVIPESSDDESAAKLLLCFSKSGLH